MVGPGSLLSTQLGCGDLSSLLGIASIFEYFLHPKNTQSPEQLINVFVSGSHSSSIFQMKYQGRSSFDVKPTLNGKLSLRSKRPVTEYLLAVQAKKHWKEFESATFGGSTEVNHTSGVSSKLSPCFEEGRVAGGAYLLIGVDSVTNSRVYKRRAQEALCSFDVPIATPTSPRQSMATPKLVPQEASISDTPSLTEPVADGVMSVVVTGVSAGLPCVKQADGNFTREAFDPLNLDRLILGENMIDNLTEKQLSVSSKFTTLF